MATTCNSELYLRPLPFLDTKWLRADITASLRNTEDTAVLWNNLVQDCEVVSSPTAPVENVLGNLSYLGDDGKHYCGVEKLTCMCCFSNFCGPLSGCNCRSCRQLDSDFAIKKITSSDQCTFTFNSDLIFESWLWGENPSNDDKESCFQTLITELYNTSLQASANCLISIHLRQQLYIYERYFIALFRCTPRRNEFCTELHTNKLVKEYNAKNLILEKFTNPCCEREKLKLRKSNERGSLSLACVGTRAALSFSFAFLRRAWSSGEDIEMCSELLQEALESLRGLQEATLFDTSEVIQYEKAIFSF